MFAALDTTNSDNARHIGAARLTGDGGAGTGFADLWATYAAIRTLTWLGLALPSHQEEATRAYLRSRRNADGGFAWQRGLASDAWATFYCSQALGDLGEPLGELGSLGQLLSTLRVDGGGFGMMPGQASDVWATYYATRTLAEVLRLPIADRAGLTAWLRELQLPDGSITWAPGHRKGDIRAFYYASVACRAAGITDPPWRHQPLHDWVRAQQNPSGAFAFAPGHPPCIWATFRATGGLQVWNWEADRKRCVDWLDRQLLADGFRRWDEYAVSDVWANFCGVGSLRHLGVDPGLDQRDRIAEAVSGFALPDGGFTYRAWQRAGDALSTATNAIVGALRPGPCHDGGTRQLAAWLRMAQMRAEDGVMYMPARGAELRCTLWAQSALALLGAPGLDMGRVRVWLGEMQNPDGGFGYWLGRGSDITSTACATALLAKCPGNGSSSVDRAALARFVESCSRGDEAANLPRAQPTVRATAQAARVFAHLGNADRALGLASGLRSHRMMGGFCNAARSLPDLHTTYECVLALQIQGLLDPSLRRSVASFLRKLRRPDGTIGWTPLSQGKTESLAWPLFLLLEKAMADPSFEMPELVL